MYVLSKYQVYSIKYQDVRTRMCFNKFYDKLEAMFLPVLDVTI
ncbi:hypothetical protein BDE36_1603 [Arcticibacter tournemirensis]|nr:hypothetical protein BDE36_1603 [Arcticibacter tournemirensis]